jgi:hypothetical protein
MKGPDMQTKRIVLSLVLSTGCGIAIPASAEEYRGTWEQQMACTPDVWRLCSDQVPDVSRIVACLRQNTPQLSNGCRAVFESSASAQPQTTGRAPPPQSAPRARAAPPVQPQPLPPKPYDDDDE